MYKGHGVSNDTTDYAILYSEVLVDEKMTMKIVLVVILMMFQ